MERLGSFAALALSTLALPTLTLQAQQQNPYSFSTQTNLVTVPTQVTTLQGEFIYGLKESEFAVTDNGVPQRVHLEEAPEQTGLSLVVVVQCSGASAMEAAKLAGLATMIDDITGAAPHEVAVLSYGKRSTLLSDFTSDPAKINAAVSAIKPCEGAAATLDAVEYATNLLEWRENHYRRAILLIGETRDHGSHATAQEVIEELGRTNTVVNSVAYSPARDQFLNDLKPDGYGSTRIMQITPLLFMAINAMKQNASSELATLSGGEYQNFTTRKGFDNALGHLANQLHNFYLLSFQPPGQPAAGYHSIHVAVPSHPGYLIRSRTTYWSEPAPPSANSP
ncbi:MAG TPA: VWA domain-containing protein [Acidobacteriaceae bacterium]|jgi:VWFA-related protein